MLRRRAVQQEHARAAGLGPHLPLREPRPGAGGLPQPGDAFAPHRDPRLREPLRRSSERASPGRLRPARRLLTRAKSSVSSSTPAPFSESSRRPTAGSGGPLRPSSCSAPGTEPAYLICKDKVADPTLEARQCSPRPPVGGDSRPVFRLDHHPAAIPEGSGDGTGSRATAFATPCWHPPHRDLDFSMRLRRVAERLVLRSPRLQGPGAFPCPLHPARRQGSRRVRSVERTAQFRRGFKRMKWGAHGSHLDETLLEAPELLVADAPLPVRYVDHPTRSSTGTSGPRKEPSATSSAGAPSWPHGGSTGKAGTSASRATTSLGTRQGCPLDAQYFL